MLEIQRQREEGQREERRETMVDASAEGAGGDAGVGVDYYDVVDNLINSTISSDSEAFNQQIEQENGQ